MHLAVIQLAAGYLCTRFAINHRHIEGAIALGLGAIIHNAITIHICHIAAHRILAPCLVCLIPKTSTVTTLDDDLALAITVDVVGHHHVVLACTDVHVRPHIHRPQQCTIQFVSLNLMACRSRIVRLVFRIIIIASTGKQAIHHHGIHFTIAI